MKTKALDLKELDRRFNAEPIDDGGPASPMTLRDYFAGQVVALGNGAKPYSSYDAVAHEAYALADAMIKARRATR